MALQSYIAVVGAANMDIVGMPMGEAFVYGDSNPGYTMLTMGGVGRNIAENIARLRVPAKLITVFGRDAYADVIRRSCMDLGIDISGSITLENERTSTYLCINDAGGDAVAAISDMGIYDRLTPTLLEDRLDMLNNAALVIIDANLSEECIAYLTKKVTVPIMADPVSSIKAVKLKNILDKLAFIKPSRIEAEILLDMKIESEADFVSAAQAFRKRGVQKVLMSLGAKGAFYSDEKAYGYLPCYPGQIVNTTGCGDAFVAAAAIGVMQGENTVTLTRMGLAAAAICAESHHTVSEKLTMAKIKLRMEGMEEDE